MLHSVKALRGCTVAAMDGDAGSARDLYLDDEKWAIHYVVICTGSWFARREVLVSPFSVMSAEWQNRILRIWLTRRQVSNSLGIDTVKPGSCRDDLAFCNHFDYPSSWAGYYPWRFSIYPTAGGAKPVAQALSSALRLHSGNAMLGHTIRAGSEQIGRIADFLFDDENWSTRLMVADIRYRAPRRHVLISPKRIERVNAEDRLVVVNITREQLDNSPEYDVMHPPQCEQLQATQLLLNLFK